MDESQAVKNHFKLATLFTEGKTCYRADDNFPGICTGLTSCVEVLKGLSRGVAPSLCGYNGFKPIVCCPESRSVFQIQSKRISAQSEFNIQEIFYFNDLFLECEEYSQLTKDRFYINEGLSSVVKSGCASSYPLFDQPMTTNNGEFPHMAAIGWTSKGFIRFKCAGSLISDRFVLTAAHVFYVNDDLPSFVRLGDQNLRNRLDGMNEVDIGISKVIVHENLNLKTYENDIALLKLESSVTFTDFIRPACLWQSWHTRILEPTVVSTGWGYLNYLGQTMDELTKVELQIVDDDSCIEILKSWNSKPLGLEGSQICAGVISDKTHACTFIGKIIELSRHFYYN